MRQGRDIFSCIKWTCFINKQEKIMKTLGALSLAGVFWAILITMATML